MINVGIDELLKNRTLIIVSNRGPVSFIRSNASLEARRGGGGLVTALSGVCRTTRARWISAAMTPGDREVALSGRAIPFPADEPSYSIRLVDIADDIYERYYNSISNPLIWFVFHYLWNLVDHPKIDRSVIEDWREGYLVANRLLAEAAVNEASFVERPVIMVQDYHLLAASRYVKKALPNVPVIHFNHIPWPEPNYFQVLPKEMQVGLIEGLLFADIVGFQTSRYARAFLACCEESAGFEVDWSTRAVRAGGRRVLTRAYPISIDANSLIDVANRENVLNHERLIKNENAGMKLIVRSDRADLSKNIVRGFEAFDRMLIDHPELKRKVRFLAFLYPTRDKLKEYADYRTRIEQTVADVNECHGTDDWQPIGLRIKDDYPESVAALKLYDVLLVNSIFDGMNLVSKEGPLVNKRNGVLVLSENAGSHFEMGEAALVINPFDVQETADALYRALILPERERQPRAWWLKEIVIRNDTTKWLYHQLKDVCSIG